MGDVNGCSSVPEEYMKPVVGLFRERRDRKQGKRTISGYDRAGFLTYHYLCAALPILAAEAAIHVLTYTPK